MHIYIHFVLIFFLTPSTTVTLFSGFVTSSSYPDTLSFQPHPRGRFKSDIISLRSVRQNICRRYTMYSKFYLRRVASMHTHIQRPKSLTVSKVLRKRQKIKSKKQTHTHTHTHNIYTYSLVTIELRVRANEITAHRDGRYRIFYTVYRILCNLEKIIMHTENCPLPRHRNILS